MIKIIFIFVTSNSMNLDPLFIAFTRQVLSHRRIQLLKELSFFVFGEFDFLCENNMHFAYTIYLNPRICRLLIVKHLLLNEVALLHQQLICLFKSLARQSLSQWYAHKHLLLCEIIYIFLHNLGLLITYNGLLSVND